MLNICNNWLRREIEQAIKTNRHIVPLLKDHALAPDKEKLNCVNYSHIYYEATITKLLSYLKTAPA
jgi:hypothetical protein